MSGSRNRCAARHRQKQTVAETRQQKNQERATQRRQEEREAAARKAERAHIDAYLNALTAPQRQALEEQAFARADDHMRQAASGDSPLAEIARRLIVDREVLRVHPLHALA